MKKNSHERFFTLSQANTGKILKLKELDGSDSPDWMRVAGVDSDLYEDRATAEREHLMSDDVKVLKGCTMRLYASLVLEWSFDLPCTFENVLEVFKQAPNLRRQVIRFVDDRKDFFNAPANLS